MSKEDILKDLMNRKNYIAFTPYFTSYMGNRRMLNMYTLPEFNRGELLERMDTEGAVNYMENITSSLEKYACDLGETPLWTSISCEISYFVDSRLRLKKDLRPRGPLEGDILRGINCVTLGISKIKAGEEFIERKTFIVNLDEFAASLEALGYLPSFYTKGIGDEVVDRVLKEGFACSPELVFTKNYKLKSFDASL